MKVIKIKIPMYKRQYRTLLVGNLTHLTQIDT